MLSFIKILIKIKQNICIQKRMYFLHLILLDFYTSLKGKSIMSHSLWNVKICLTLKFETLIYFL